MASLLASVLVALLSLIFPSLATAIGESLSLSASPPHHRMVYLSPPPPPHQYHQHDRTVRPTHPHEHSRDHDKDDPPSPPPHHHHHHHHNDKHTHELFLRPHYGRGYRGPREPLLPPYPRRSRPPPRIVVPPYIHPHKPPNNVAPPRHAHKYVPPRKMVPPNRYGHKRKHKTPPRGKKRGGIHRFPRPQRREDRRHSKHENRPVPRKHWTPYHKSFPPQPHHLQPRHDRRKARKQSPLKRRYHGKGKLLGKRHPFPLHPHEKKRRRKKHHRHHSGAELQHKHSLMAQPHHDKNSKHFYYQNDQHDNRAPRSISLGTN